MYKFAMAKINDIVEADHVLKSDTIISFTDEEKLLDTTFQWVQFSTGKKDKRVKKVFVFDGYIPKIDNKDYGEKYMMFGIDIRTNNSKLFSSGMDYSVFKPDPKNQGIMWQFFGLKKSFKGFKVSQEKTKDIHIDIDEILNLIREGKEVLKVKIIAYSLIKTNSKGTKRLFILPRKIYLIDIVTTPIPPKISEEEEKLMYDEVKGSASLITKIRSLRERGAGSST